MALTGLGSGRSVSGRVLALTGLRLEDPSLSDDQSRLKEEKRIPKNHSPAKMIRAPGGIELPESRRRPITRRAPSPGA